MLWLIAIGSSVASAARGQSGAGGIDPNQLVLQAVERAVWGPSIHCRVSQTSSWDGYEVVSRGEYWHGGNGTGQTKFQMKLEAGDQKWDFLQVSDGRLVWTNLGGGEAPRRVYLDPIREALGGWVRKPGIQPEASLYLAIGGQAEAMRCLYQRYLWIKIFAGMDDKRRDVWQLVGKLRTIAPNPSADTYVDRLMLAPTPPAEVPTDVRLTLARAENLALFPYRIEYYRVEKDREGSPGRWHRISLIEYDDVLTPVEFPSDFFNYQASDQADKIIDETKDYMPVNPQAILHSQLRR